MRITSSFSRSWWHSIIPEDPPPTMIWHRRLLASIISSSLAVIERIKMFWLAHDTETENVEVVHFLSILRFWALQQQLPPSGFRKSKKKKVEEMKECSYSSGRHQNVRTSVSYRRQETEDCELWTVNCELWTSTSSLLSPLSSHVSVVCIIQMCVRIDVYHTKDKITVMFSSIR